MPSGPCVTAPAPPVEPALIRVVPLFWTNPPLKVEEALERVVVAPALVSEPVPLSKPPNVMIPGPEPLVVQPPVPMAVAWL